MPSDGQWAMNYSETTDACLRSGLRVICGETHSRPPCPGRPPWRPSAAVSPLAGTGPESGAEGEGLVRLVSQAWGEFVSVALVSARRGRPPQGAGPGLVPETPGPGGQGTLACSSLRRRTWHQRPGASNGCQQAPSPVMGQVHPADSLEHTGPWSSGPGAAAVHLSG